jgi:hypothetical protein
MHFKAKAGHPRGTYRQHLRRSRLLHVRQHLDICLLTIGAFRMLLIFLVENFPARKISEITYLPWETGAMAMPSLLGPVFGFVYTLCSPVLSGLCQQYIVIDYVENTC